MMRRIMMMMVGSLVAAGAMAQELSVRVYQPSKGLKEFTAVLDTVSSAESQTAAAREFQKKYAEDVTVQTMAANVLALENLDATRQYYRDLAARAPDNVAASYLAGRLSEKASERREYADKILAKDPDSYWGNLLLAMSLMRADDPDMSKAEAALRKAIATDNSLPPAVEELGKLKNAKGQRDEADRIFTRLAEMLPDKFAPVRYRMMLTEGDHQKAMKLVDDYLVKNPEDSEALNTKAAGMRELKDWDGYVATMRRLVAQVRDGENAYNLACAFSLSGKPDSAFAWLFTAADLGFNDIEQYKSDEDLVPLHKDARWSEVLTRVEESEKAELAQYMQKMQRSAPERKEKSLKERGSEQAPDFELQDLKGKPVKLSALKGKVVVLDFWATWCGPCKRTMPLLDKFYAEQRPEGVEVFGVNVLERGGTDGVKPYIEKNGYRFPILYGTGDLATAYGVRGIPTLVVIDKQGRIAYRHVGFDPSLPEVLSWQTQELLKQ